ncbi:MAG: hypothetical protein KAS66_14810 [Candidatus Omnitrophica bacterium]|nr:hypothetical protein [Candidatus Omnitrophota bacterium]
MIDYTGLIRSLDVNLSEFNYINEPMISIPNILYVAYIKDRSIFKVKNLCSVIDLPDNMIDINTAKNFMKFLKKSLLAQYGDAFLWKELEMCFVVLCNDKLYKLLKASGGKIMNEASFSLSAMLGTCFINKETIDNFSASTWGIYFSGDHFAAVDKIVKQWIKEIKVARGG